MARSYAAKVRGQAHYMARRAAFHEGYEPAESGEACVYCGGRADCVDHVPPLAAVEAMSAAELVTCRRVLVRACMACNRALWHCRSGDVAERRAWALDVRSGRRGERRRAEAVAGYRVLVSRDGFEVRLTGWRNAYVAFVKDEVGEWQQVGSGGCRSVLIAELATETDVSQADLWACDVLPELPREVPAGSGLLRAAPPAIGEPGSGIAVPGELLQLRVPESARSYRVYARRSADAEWERVFGASKGSTVVRRCKALGLAPEFVAACEAVPELPADWREVRTPGEA